MRWSEHKENVELFLEPRLKIDQYNYKATKAKVCNLHPIVKKRILDYRTEIDEYYDNMWMGCSDIELFNDHMDYLISKSRHVFEKMNKILGYIKFDDKEKDRIIGDIETMSKYIEYNFENEDYGVELESIDFEYIFKRLLCNGVIL